jgi:hypothetical protein
MMIYLPPEYDDRKCPKCNREIQKQIEEKWRRRYEKYR